MKYLILFFTCFSLSYAHSRTEDDLEYYEHGTLHFLEQGNWRDAFSAAFSALHSTEDGSREQARIFSKIGFLYLYFDKSYGDAEGYYRKALQIDPYQYDALMGSGDVYFARAEYVGALDFYQRARKYHKDRFEPWASIAAAFYERAEVEKAMVHFEEALKLNPKDVVSLNNLGNIYFDKRRMQEAKHYYLRALDVDPEFVSAHNNMAVLLYELREYNESLRHMKEALRLDWHDGGLHANLANIYFDLRQVERAKYHLRLANKQQDHPVHWNNLAVMEKFTDEELNAGIAYAKTLSRRPDYSNARKKSGFFRKRHVMIPEALKDNYPHSYNFYYQDRKGWPRIKWRNHRLEAYRNRYSVSSP